MSGPRKLCFCGSDGDPARDGSERKLLWVQKQNRKHFIWQILFNLMINTYADDISLCLQSTTFKKNSLLFSSYLYILANNGISHYFTLKFPHKSYSLWLNRMPVISGPAAPHSTLSRKEELSDPSLHQRVWRSMLPWHQEIPQRHLHLWWVRSLYSIFLPPGGDICWLMYHKPALADNCFFSSSVKVKEIYYSAGAFGSLLTFFPLLNETQNFLSPKLVLAFQNKIILATT